MPDVDHAIVGVLDRRAYRGHVGAQLIDRRLIDLNLHPAQRQIDQFRADLQHQLLHIGRERCLIIRVGGVRLVAQFGFDHRQRRRRRLTLQGARDLVLRIRRKPPQPHRDAAVRKGESRQPRRVAAFGMVAVDARLRCGRHGAILTS